LLAAVAGAALEATFFAAVAGVDAVFVAGFATGFAGTAFATGFVADFVDGFPDF
jgi:hypothetical protein